MSLERIKEARQALFEQIVADMESGAQWQKDWSFPAPFNPKSGTVYRGRNALLLSFYMRVENIEDPRFMTFKQAKDEGYSIAKGCHSYPIEKWMKIAYDTSDSNKRIKQPKTPKEWEAVENDPDLGVKFVVVGSWNLFNARDIKGISAYEGSSGIGDDTEAIDFLEGNSPCPVSEERGDDAYYAPALDRIVVPQRSQFSSGLSMARVLLHEQGHATGAKSRLDRGLELTGQDRDAYAREELTAELSSLFTANELGIALPALGSDDLFSKSDYWENHVAYIKSWSSAFEDPVSELMQAASRAGSASDYLMRECFGEPLAAIREHGAPKRTHAITAPERTTSEQRSLDRDLKTASEHRKTQFMNIAHQAPSAWQG